jgi:DNA-3-methyladenine glycosylase I
VLRRRPGAGQARASSKNSDAMSLDLKRRGFRFVGSTICHAFMQAVGMMDEHERRCWVARRG